MKEGKEILKMNEIATIISTVGFPIAACIACGMFIKWIIEQNNKNIADVRAEQASINRSMQQAINNNTKALQELIKKLDLCKAVEKDDK